MNRDSTRLIFWLDLAVLFVGAALAIAGKWDYLLALAIGLVLMNGMDGFWKRRPPQ